MALNEEYKKRSRINPFSKNAQKYHQGYFHPSNPDKWLDPNNIICRSGWEFKFCEWCDRNPNVNRCASEPIGIEYRNPIANYEYCKKNGLNPNDPNNWKIMKYYTDFWVEFKDKNGVITKWFFEIKPKKETMPPKPITQNAPLKEYKAYVRSMQIYMVNKAKWIAAEKYFNDRGCKFMVLNEDHLDRMHLVLK